MLYNYQSFNIFNNSKDEKINKQVNNKIVLC